MMPPIKLLVTLFEAKNKKARKIIVAVPVSGKRVAQEIKDLVDEIVVLEVPPFFQAVAQVYREVTEILKNIQKKINE